MSSASRAGMPTSCRASRGDRARRDADGEPLRDQPRRQGQQCRVAAARQGARVALIARVGGDDFGEWAWTCGARKHRDRSRRSGSRRNQRRGADPGLRRWRQQHRRLPRGECGSRRAPRASGAGDAQSVPRVMASCEVPLPATMEAFRIAREGCCHRAESRARAAAARPAACGGWTCSRPTRARLPPRRTDRGASVEAGAQATARARGEGGAGHPRRAGCVLHRPESLPPPRRAADDGGGQHRRGRHLHRRAGRGAGARRAAAPRPCAGPTPPPRFRSRAAAPSAACPRATRSAGSSRKAIRRSRLPRGARRRRRGRWARRAGRAARARGLSGIEARSSPSKLTRAVGCIAR